MAELLDRLIQRLRIWIEDECERRQCSIDELVEMVTRERDAALTAAGRTRKKKEGRG